MFKTLANDGLPSMQSYVTRISQQPKPHCEGSCGSRPIRIPSDSGGQQAEPGLGARAPWGAAAEEKSYPWESSPSPQQLVRPPVGHSICQRGSAVPSKDLEDIPTPNNSGRVKVDVWIGGLTDGSALSPLMVRSVLCKVWVWLVETGQVSVQNLAVDLKCPYISPLLICK